MRPIETIEDLKAWRHRLGLTQQRLADILGTTQTTIGRWEAGLRRWPPFLHFTLLGLEVADSVMRACGARLLEPKRGIPGPLPRNLQPGGTTGGSENGSGSQRAT
jgi:transcriptional regulator with XRE-family HTH domain